MATETIFLQIDSEAARVFHSASSEMKEQLGRFVSAWIMANSNRHSSALKNTMDELSNKALARGLTPEILAEILKDD